MLVGKSDTIRLKIENTRTSTNHVPGINKNGEEGRGEEFLYSRKKIGEIEGMKLNDVKSINSTPHTDSVAEEWSTAISSYDGQKAASLYSDCEGRAGEWIKERAMVPVRVEGDGKSRPSNDPSEINIINKTII